MCLIVGCWYSIFGGFPGLGPYRCGIQSTIRNREGVSDVRYYSYFVFPLTKALFFSAPTSNKVEQ